VHRLTVLKKEQRKKEKMRNRDSSLDRILDSIHSPIIPPANTQEWCRQLVESVLLSELDIKGVSDEDRARAQKKYEQFTGKEWK
jgi:hypothetical protein